MEAKCKAQDESQYGPLLELQKCYRINGYVIKPGWPYMPMVPYQASLLLGRRVTIQPIENDIPTYYYTLASFDDFKARKTLPKILTGNISYIHDINININDSQI